jgi:hypothetical protein
VKNERGWVVLNSKRRSGHLLCLLIWLLTTVASFAEAGRVELKSTPDGDYYQYVAGSHDGGEPRVLVIVHGSLDSGQTARQAAKAYIQRWLEFAEKERLILVAPAFDRNRYQSYGGYRGLFGRSIGADQFVHNAVDEWVHGGKFMLYGHSAGGQFVVRYAVRHPQRLSKAVACAPGRYAFPNRSVSWPYGAGGFSRTLSYSQPSEQKLGKVSPDWNGWLRASQLPLTIVVGSQDTEVQPSRPGHRGKTRIDLARHWASDMNKLNPPGNIKVRLVKGVGHSSRRLTPACMEELRR